MLEAYSEEMTGCSACYCEGGWPNFLHEHDLMPCDAVSYVIVDVSDIVAILDAYAGLSYFEYCPNPCSGMAQADGGSQVQVEVAPATPSGSTTAGLSVSLVMYQPDAGAPGSLRVDVFASGIQGMRAYEVALDGLDAEGVALEVLEAGVDANREDYVFKNRQEASAGNRRRASFVGVLYSGEVTTSSRQYVGHVVYRHRASDRESNQTIQLRPKETRAMDSRRRPIAISARP